MTRSLSFDLLPDGSPVLTVGESCIQTATRQAHRELTVILLEENAAGAALGPVADMLERFLATTNFAALRAEHPELAGGHRCRVRLYRGEDGGVRWEVVEPR
jgi:hypothetical protein